MFTHLSSLLTVYPFSLHDPAVVCGLWHRARKIVNLRLFDDDNGKPWEKSVADRKHEILCVSQVGSMHTLFRVTHHYYKKTTEVNQIKVTN